MGTTGAGLAPRNARARVQFGAAIALVVLAFAGSAAVRVHGALADPHTEVGAEVRAEVGAEVGIELAPVTTAASTGIVAAPAPEPERFTIGDLAAGRVPQDVQDRFWQAQLDAIVDGPCPDAPAAGATTVTLFLGADEAWTARLTEASAAKHAACHP